MTVIRPSCFPDGVSGCTSRDVTLADGARLRLVESGVAGRPPVLLVHGFGASAYQWRYLLPALGAAGYHALAPDLPGHGFSQLTFPRGEYSRASFARRMWMLLDALDIPCATLIGHSMGGAIVAAMAHSHPARVSRLALLSPVGFGLVPPRARFLRAVPDPLAPLAQRFASRTTARIVLRDVYGPDGHWTARDEEELLAPYAQRDIYRALLRTLKEFDFRLHRNVDLAGLPAETMVLFGTHDRVVRPCDLDARMRLVPAGRAVLLPRVGHLPQVEAHAEVTRLMLEHLSAARVAVPTGAH